jgi:hypothetical protein
MPLLKTKDIPASDLPNCEGSANSQTSANLPPPAPIAPAISRMLAFYNVASGGSPAAENRESDNPV